MVITIRLLCVSTEAIPEKLALRELIDWLQTKGSLYYPIKPFFCGNTPILRYSYTDPLSCHNNGTYSITPYCTQ